MSHAGNGDGMEATMNGLKRRFLIRLLEITDLSLMACSLGTAILWISYPHDHHTFANFLAMRVKLSNFLIFAFLIAAWRLLFRQCGLYKSHRLSTKWEEIGDTVRATTGATLVLMLATAPFSVHIVSPRFLLAFWFAGTLAIGGVRLVLRALASELRKRGRNLRHILILGTNSRALNFARTLSGQPERGYRLVGFVDDKWQEFETFLRSGYPLASDYESLPEFLRRNVVDEVAVFLPLRSFHGHCSEIAGLCQQHGITLRFDSDIFGLKASGLIHEEFEGDHHISTGVRNPLHIAAKRVFDLVAASLILICVSPILLVAAILIKLSDRGPVFFQQERVGVNKRRFHIYKFRTMVRNAERLVGQLESRNEMSGPVFKMKNDPRITPIGKVLRKTSIDELPQLLNVIKGEMSMVGPRPLPVRDFEGFNEDWQRRRFSVRPGITCLWQVSGRNGIPFEQWMKLDLQYLDEWSLWLDLKILAQTIPAVLKGSGAA